MADDALTRIEKIAKGHKLKGGEHPSPSVQFNANKEILNQAHGRPETRDGRTGQAEAGLTIVINQLTAPDAPKEVQVETPVLEVPAVEERNPLIMDVGDVQVMDSLQEARDAASVPREDS